MLTLDPKTNALIIAGIWVLYVVSFPETLFSRTEFSTLKDRTYLERFTFLGKVIDKPLSGRDFLNNFTMLKYWAVVIPCIYYMTANVYGSLLFVLSLPSLSAKIYHFGTAQTGLFIGVPLSVGCLIGESFTGWISDYFAVRYAKRHDGYYKPEVRLWLMPLGLCLPVGLIVAGFCLENGKPWITVAVGMAIASVGVQAATTLTYSYISDCYKPQAAEVSTVINLFRFVFAFTIGFYALPFGADIGQAKEWSTLAAINFATWLMLLVFVFKGEAIRKSQGLPKLHEDL
jgi:MFS family permease